MNSIPTIYILHNGLGAGIPYFKHSSVYQLHSIVLLKIRTQNRRLSHILVDSYSLSTPSDRLSLHSPNCLS